MNQISLSYVIPVYFNQENSNTLVEQLKYYSSFSPAVLDSMEFIIVDDHSTVDINIPSTINLNYRQFRITDDIPWNQGGARNLGAVHAAEKMILTDCDHTFPEKLIVKILKSRVPKKMLYTFKRVNADGKVIKGQRNTFFTSKQVFFAALGVDEEFCGNYGYEDLMFRDFARRIGVKIRHLTRRFKIVAFELDRDNSYHSLVREKDINYNLYQEKLKILKTRDFYQCHSKKILNFNYELVKENYR